MINNTFSNIAGLIALVFTLTLASSGSAQWYSADANPHSTLPIGVALQDNAQNACWTNLRDSLVYAREKLSLKGYSLLDDTSSGLYGFYITVDAFRKNGSCNYTITIDLEKDANLEGIAGIHNIGSHGVFGYHPNNANIAVIEAIQAMVDKM